jgi:hypothetical protein
VRSVIASQNMPKRTYNARTLPNPFPHALPHAHCRCGSAIIRTGLTFFYPTFQCGRFYLGPIGVGARRNAKVIIVVVFPQAPFRATNVPRPTLVSSNCALHHGFLRKAVGDFVTPFVLEKLFDYSCSVERAGSYYGHAPTSSGKFV